MRDLSILIPARREEWLLRTVQDVLANKRANTDVIVVADGELPLEPLPQHNDLSVVILPQSIGQRAATNLSARISTGRYLMKIDAHVSVAEGFDRVLIGAASELDWRTVQIPAQKNLHIYSWECLNVEGCGYSKYQGTPMEACPNCHGPIERVVYWKPRRGTTTTSWRLDEGLHFQYWSDGANRQESDISDVMTSLGACFFMSRAWWEHIEGLDEGHGSWGQFGAEIALKTWLGGGRHVVNRRTWFAHFFRVGGIGFPYPISHSDQEYARTYSRNLWMGNHWPKQVKPLSWLIEKFAPLPGWHEAQGADAMATVTAAGERFGRRRTRGVVYYSDNRVDASIDWAVREHIEASGMPIVAVTLHPIQWPSAKNIVLDAERGYLTMFRQILAGLEALDTDDVFFCEHDVLYHRSHFQFTPPNDSTYFYNLNVFKVDAATGRAVTYETKQTSGLCADRQLLIAHYRERIRRVEAEGFSTRMGFEPGSHGRKERVDNVPSDVWRSPFPNVDIRHDRNLTPSRWSPEQFRDQRNCQGWTEADAIPGWGETKGRFWDFLADNRQREAMAI
jgi:hypothetical protein